MILTSFFFLTKGVHPYEYMDSWDRFNETTLPNKKAFYRKLYLENITDEDYVHSLKVLEEFKLKRLGEYHDLYVQSDTLLLADVFAKLSNKYIEMYNLDPLWEKLLKNKQKQLKTKKEKKLTFQRL